MLRGDCNFDYHIRQSNSILLMYEHQPQDAVQNVNPNIGFKFVTFTQVVDCPKDPMIF